MTAFGASGIGCVANDFAKFCVSAVRALEVVAVESDVGDEALIETVKISFHDISPLSRRLFVGLLVRKSGGSFFLHVHDIISVCTKSKHRLSRFCKIYIPVRNFSSNGDVNNYSVVESLSVIAVE